MIVNHTTTDFKQAVILIYVTYYTSTLDFLEMSPNWHSLTHDNPKQYDSPWLYGKTAPLPELPPPWVVSPQIFACSWQQWVHARFHVGIVSFSSWFAQRGTHTLPKLRTEYQRFLYKYFTDKYLFIFKLRIFSITTFDHFRTFWVSLLFTSHASIKLLPPATKPLANLIISSRQLAVIYCSNI